MASERAFAAVIGASWLLVAHVQAENVNCPCDSVIPNGVGLVNLRVDSSAFDQIETTIDVVDLGATSKILSGYITQWGANCNPRDIVRQVGFAYSTNSGTNWSGGDTLPPGSSLKLADPWLGISGYDTAYYCYLEGPLGSKRLKLDWSGDWGATWHGPVVLDSLYDPDKPALATGFVPFHPDSGLLHIAYWATGPIRYGRSTDGGRSFSFEWFSNGTGPSIAVNRLGWVYVVWTHAGSPGRGVKIRMSVNGGTTFNPEVTVNAGHPAVVHQLPLKPLWVKGQGFPVVAADTSGGEFDIHDSTVYIAWAGLKYGPLETPDTASATPNYDPDIFLAWSRIG